MLKLQWPGPMRTTLAFILIASGVAAANDAVETRMRKDITFLASDACEGRGVTTQGIDLAANYIVEAFQKAHVRPAGPDGSYFQPFPMSGGAKLGSPNILLLHGPQGQEIGLQAGSQFLPLGLSGAGRVSAPMVFVGYGATAKEAGYDDYQGMDVAGKVVVVLRKTPRMDNPYVPFNGSRSAYLAALTTKIANAEAHKAAAIIFVNDRETSASADPLMDFAYTAYAGGSNRLPALHLRRGILDSLLQSVLGIPLSALETDIDRDLKPHSAIMGWSAHLEINVQRVTVQAKNIVGVLEGSGGLAHETVIVGAHYDHLGYGGPGSLARINKHAIHHGADDNGSGTTAIIELARRFGKSESNTSQPKSRRRLVLMAFSGEESGLLGSEYYCKHPLFPLDDTVTMVNLDMVGRLRPDKEVHLDKLIVYGTGTAKAFDHLIDRVNTSFHFKLHKVRSGFGPSDHASFYAKKIPVFFFFTGDHPDYHKPTDTADKINVSGMRQVTDLVESLVIELRSKVDRPQYVKVEEKSSGSPGFSGPRLGVRPSYGDEKEGVLLADVNGGSAAAKGGLKAGDRIVEISGKAVKNLEVYMMLMANQKKGQPIDIVILRDGKKITLKVTPE